MFFDVFRWFSEILIICTFFRVSFRLFRADLPAWSDLALTESFQVLNARVLRLQCPHHRNPRSFHLHIFENPNGDYERRIQSDFSCLKKISLLSCFRTSIPTSNQSGSADPPKQSLGFHASAVCCHLRVQIVCCHPCQYPAVSLLQQTNDESQPQLLGSENQPTQIWGFLAIVVCCNLRVRIVCCNPCQYPAVSLLQQTNYESQPHN